MRRKGILVLILLLMISAALVLGAGVILADNPSNPTGAPLAVISVTVTAQGSGYTTATVSFSGGGGSGAAATAKVASGKVTAVTVTNFGSGYTTAPSVTISGDGTGATATASRGMPSAEVYYWNAENNYLLHNTRLSNCALCHSWGTVNVALGAGGSGYTSAPTVTLTAPPAGGLQATAKATVTGGVVTALTIDDPGYAYTTAPTVSFGGPGTGATGSATLTTTWGLNAYGQDLLNALNARATATANVTAVYDGKVLTAVVLTGGGGYTTAPSVNFAGGGGSGAAATATIANGAVTGITITNQGSGYTSAPTITIGAGGTGVMGDGLLFTADANTIVAALTAIENNSDDANAFGSHGAAMNNKDKIWALTFPGHANDGPRDIASPGDIGGIHGNYGDTPDQCARCHRFHTAQAPKLLNRDQYGLCTTCHDGTGAATNVVNGILGAGPSGLKGGGFSAVTQDTGLTGTVGTHSVTSKHMVDDSDPAWLGTMWGNGAINSGAGKLGVGIECGDCHDPHNPAWDATGSGTPIYQYRMLKLASPAGGDTVAYSNIARLAVPAEAGTHDYAQAYDATTDRPVTTYQPNDRIGQFCAQCHTRYMRGSSVSHTAYGIVEEMSTGDNIFTFQHATKEANCERASCHAGTSFTRPRCVDCHNAHGTSAQMGTYSSSVPYPGGAVNADFMSPTSLATRSSLLRIDNRGVCTVCHPK